MTPGKPFLGNWFQPGHLFSTILNLGSPFKWICIFTMSLIFYLLIYLCVYVSVWMFVTAHKGRSENNLQESLLSSNIWDLEIEPRLSQAAGAFIGWATKNPKPLSFNLPFFLPKYNIQDLESNRLLPCCSKNQWTWFLLPDFYNNSAFPYSHPNGSLSPACGILSFYGFHVQSLSYFFYKPLPKA